MTDMETKAAELQKTMETAQADAKAAKEAAEAVKTELDAKNAELKKAREEIDNLDKSVKEQATDIETLRKAIQSNPKSWKTAVREALESKKEEIAKLMKNETGKFTIAFKADGPALTIGAYTAQTGSRAYGTALDPDIAGAPALPLVFLQIFGIKPLNGSRIAWREASTTENVDYVAELASNTNKSGVSFSEKFRQFGKIATYTEISSEAEIWFDELVNFVQNEGQRIVLNKVDTEIWSGDGNDSTKPTHFYGVKSAATAFSALGSYPNANLADVIFDAIEQIKKEGYNADSVVLSPSNVAKLRGLKNDVGGYLYDAVNHQLGQVKVYSSAKLTNDELFVCDSFCTDVHLGSTYELEFSRVAATDSWRVDFRRVGQVKTKTPWKKGLIYVASISTALASISDGSDSLKTSAATTASKVGDIATKSGTIASKTGTIADNTTTLASDSKVFKTQEQGSGA